jgi:two-component system OmpR family sensor kinase
VRRLPIRFKLTLAFAGIMALVLAATGLFVYLRLQDELDRSIDNGLRTRADEVSALIRHSGSSFRRGGKDLIEKEEGFAQILDTRGRVIDSSFKTRAVPLLSDSERGRALQNTIFLNRDAISGIDPDEAIEARLLATPVRTQEERLVIIVGASQEDRNDALANLKRLLLIGGPVALLLSSLAAFGVASASLRPVERMRRRAAAISSTEPGQRLPVPPANDEIGRLGHTLNAMLTRLEKSFNRERAFVSDASHELRTPLAVLKTELELAMRGGRSVEELEAALESAVEETDRVVQLAEDLLVIARSDQGRLPVRLTPVEVEVVLADVKERFAIRSRETKRALVAEPTGDLRLSADPIRLRQALGNLVDNALRYGSGTVRLSARPLNGRVELHVSDEGRGFPPDFIDAAFERFSRADGGRGRGGTGLGLAIVQAIAKAHQGEAVAANLPDGGADVWLNLPVEPGEFQRSRPSE